MGQNNSWPRVGRRYYIRTKTVKENPISTFCMNSIREGRVNEKPSKSRVGKIVRSEQSTVRSVDSTARLPEFGSDRLGELELVT